MEIYVWHRRFLLCARREHREKKWAHFPSFLAWTPHNSRSLLFRLMPVRLLHTFDWISLFRLSYSTYIGVATAAMAMATNDAKPNCATPFSLGLNLCVTFFFAVLCISKITFSLFHHPHETLFVVAHNFHARARYTQFTSRRLASRHFSLYSSTFDIFDMYIHLCVYVWRRRRMKQHRGSPSSDTTQEERWKIHNIKFCLTFNIFLGTFAFKKSGFQHQHRHHQCWSE